MARKRRKVEDVNSESQPEDENAEPVANPDEEKPKAEDHQPSVVAVYDPPDGVHRVNVTTPSGNDYSVPYREPFEIRSEDADFFFRRWRFRRNLRRADEARRPVRYGGSEPRDEYRPNRQYQDTTVRSTKTDTD